MGCTYQMLFFQSEHALNSSQPLHEEALNWLGLDHPGINPFLGITDEHPGNRVEIGLVFKYQAQGNVNKFLEKVDKRDKIEFVRSKVSLVNESAETY